MAIEVLAESGHILTRQSLIVISMDVKKVSAQNSRYLTVHACLKNEVRYTCLCLCLCPFTSMFLYAFPDSPEQGRPISGFSLVQSVYIF